jgi:hypothetical protein
MEKIFSNKKVGVSIGVLHYPILTEISSLKFRALKTKDKTSIFPKGFAIQNLEGENKSC